MAMTGLTKVVCMASITLERVRAYHDKKPRRICFSITHKNALKRSSSPSQYIGTFNVPFGETIQHLFPFQLKRNYSDKIHPDAMWLSIQSEEVYSRAKDWVDAQDGRVFFRDCLYTSVALDMNVDADKKFTYIGALEEKAKKSGDTEATLALTQKYVEAISSYPLYLQADMVVAVPPSLGKDPQKHLPSRIATLVAKQLNKTDITHHLIAQNPKKPVKGLALEKKWEEWEKTQLSYNGDLTGKTIILLDDKYQSGSSIQYVAMILQKAGASQIYGLCAVSTQSNTDNQ